MKQLLFITTSSLATNPRLVKEFEALKQSYQCTIFCFKHFDWSLELSNQIVARNPEVKFIEIDRKKHVLETVVSKMCHKMAILLNPLFKKNLLITAFASNDKTPQLLFQTFKLSERNHIKTVIAHNLGAFYPAMRLANSTRATLQLDVEDYYPGEALYFNKTYEKANRVHLLQDAFRKADTITYASEGIALECQKQFEIGSNVQQCTILNAFSSEDFDAPTNNHSEPIKCVWFSQHIGPNRGLEQVFEAAKNLEHIEFHLIGNRNHTYLDNQDLSSNIIVQNSMTQEHLHTFLNQMDIGLALENVEADHNRNICLTNKILAYAQAGLYILATDTFGQAQFLTALDYKAGTIMRSTLQEALKKMDTQVLQTSAKYERWQKAKSYSWDKEQLKLKALVQ